MRDRKRSADRPSRRTFLATCALGGAAIFLAACQPPLATSGPSAAAPQAPQAPSPGSASDPLYEAARKEGKVVVTTHDAEELKPFAEAFQRRYPGIEVEPQIGRGRDNEEKIIADQQARVYRTDVMTGGQGNVRALQDHGAIEPYQSPELEHVREALLDPEKVFGTERVNIYGITINTRLVPPAEEPKSWADLLNPRWKGKIAIQDPRGSGGGMSNLVALSKVPELGEPFIYRLAEQDLFIGRQNEQLIVDLARGEHAMLISGTNNNAVQQRQKGMPVKFIKPTEGVKLTIIWMGVVKNAPHPNAARLWIDWMLSTEGQELLASQGLTPVRKGVQAREPESDLEGVKLLQNETREELAKRGEYSRLWESIFFKR